MEKYCEIHVDSMCIICANKNHGNHPEITIKLFIYYLSIKDVKFCVAFKTYAMPTLLSKIAIRARARHLIESAS